MSLAGLLLKGFGPAGGGGGGGAPPVLALTVVDLADGTGATATLTNSDAAATNLVYAAPAVGLAGSVAFALAGSRTGSGVVPLALAVGYYYVYATSDLGNGLSVSNVVAVFVTDSAAVGSVHHGLMLAVKAEIDALVAAGSLSGIVTGSVRVRKVPSAKDYTTALPLPPGKHAYPGVLVCPGTREDVEEATNKRDDYGYPVLVVVAAVDNQDLEANQDLYLTWRQRIADRFRQLKTLSISNPATDFHDCQVETGPIVNWERFQGDGVFASALVLHYSTRRAR